MAIKTSTYVIYDMQTACLSSARLVSNLQYNSIKWKVQTEESMKVELENNTKKTRFSSHAQIEQSYPRGSSPNPKWMLIPGTKTNIFNSIRDKKTALECLCKGCHCAWSKRFLYHSFSPPWNQTWSLNKSLDKILSAHKRDGELGAGYWLKMPADKQKKSEDILTTIIIKKRPWPGIHEGKWTTDGKSRQTGKKYIHNDPGERLSPGRQWPSG